MKLEIYTPVDGLYKVIEASLISLPASDGRRAILKGHLPIIMSLLPSTLQTEEEDRRHFYQVSGGAFSFKDNKGKLFTEKIEEINI